MTSKGAESVAFKPMMCGFSVSESQPWELMKLSLRSCVTKGWREDVELCLDQSMWPIKLLLKPLQADTAG